MPAREAEILVGGQAVLEGVMMKLPRAWAVTVRRADGQLVSRGGSFTPWTDRWPVLKLPLLRGVATLGSMMVLGMRALFFSSDVLARDLEAAAPEARPGPKPRRRLRDLFTLSLLALTTAVTSGPEGDEMDEAPAPPPPAPAAAEPSGMPMGQLVLSLGMALGMFLLVFKALPLGAAWLLGRWFPALGTPLAESLISGVALAVVFVGYLYLMSLLPDIRRVFQYHGAEHQVVHVHEAGQPHDVAHAAAWPTLHPRCGTSFLFFVVLTSIVVWSLFAVEAGFLTKLGLRLALLPLILGLSFELIRLSARHRGNWFFRGLMAPGLWSQRITTKPPDDGMREVALRSLDLALVTPEGPSRS